MFPQIVEITVYFPSPFLSPQNAVRPPKLERLHPVSLNISSGSGTLVDLSHLLV